MINQSWVEEGFSYAPLGLFHQNCDYINCDGLLMIDDPFFALVAPKEFFGCAEQKNADYQNNLHRAHFCIRLFMAQKSYWACQMIVSKLCNRFKWTMAEFSHHLHWCGHFDTILVSFNPRTGQQHKLSLFSVHLLSLVPNSTLIKLLSLYHW